MLILTLYFEYNGCLPVGEVPEWTIGAVSKTVVALAATEGSNPSLSAECFIPIEKS